MSLLRIVVAAGLVLGGCELSSEPLCAVYPEIVTVGETVSLQVGKVLNQSDCRPDVESVRGFTWSSVEGTVELEPGGKMKALRPGSYSAVARRKRDTLQAQGVVLPAKWIANVQLPKEAVRVGETISIRVRVEGPDGRVLPNVPYTIFSEPATVLRSRQGFGGKAGEFVAIGKGRALVKAHIGRREIVAPLDVVTD
jgi:hypothetical protein